MITVQQSSAFTRWIKKLKDPQTRALIVSRINRLVSGAPCDVKYLRDNLCELRIHYQSGYRVYFVRDGDAVILLLCGGDKGSQSRDIDAAVRIYSEWRNYHD